MMVKNKGHQTEHLKDKHLFLNLRDVETKSFKKYANNLSIKHKKHRLKQSFPSYSTGTSSERESSSTDTRNLN